MLRWSSGRRQRSKIPLGPPLEKGEDSRFPVRNPIESPLFVKGGWGDFIYFLVLGKLSLLPAACRPLLASTGLEPFPFGPDAYWRMTSNTNCVLLQDQLQVSCQR